MQRTEPKFIELEGALAQLKSNQTVVTAMAASEPQLFFSALAERAKSLHSLRVYCANPNRRYPCFNPSEELQGRIELLVMFLTSKVADCQGYSRTHYVPQHLSQWVPHINSLGGADVFWGSCSEPDPRGFVSLGLNNCYESEVFRSAKVRILEVNPELPTTLGSTIVPVQNVDAFVRSQEPLPTITRPAITAADRQIGEYVSELVEDGSTIQLGIGAIPNAIGEAISRKKDLGVHTEMINDTIMDLYLKGAINNSRKTRWPGKMIGSFVYGSAELYRFVHMNPFVELHPSSVVNDPYRIGQNHKMVSINTALEVDITGQVCSESIGHHEISGVGGAFETHSGAQRSPGGRGIIALQSRTHDGRFSKITFELKPGAKVSVPRNDVDTIVTEFGIAELRGRPVSERVRALTKIAHPDFRDELLHKAQAHGYI
jgi:acyl-CoA hydrolase